MQRGKKSRPDDNQVFLIMGTAEGDDNCQIAIVIADGVERARTVFEKTFRGSTAMTYPSLKDIRDAVEWMEDARNGGIPAQAIVINDMV